MSDAWRLSELRADDGELHGLVRKRAPVPPEGRGIRAWLTLEFQPTPSSLPSSEDSRRMAAFEDRLDEEIEKAGLGVLMAVVIVDGKRDHLFYLSNSDAFVRRISNLVDEMKEFRPQLEVAPDPDWNEFHEMIG